MLLQQLVRTSLLVADTSSRLAKIELLAALLRQATPDEIEIVIAYLSGSVRQAKLGVGWATLQAARVAPSETASLGILAGEVFNVGLVVHFQHQPRQFFQFLFDHRLTRADPLQDGILGKVVA